MNKGRMERFTQRARRALSYAQEATVNQHQSSIGTEHLLLGLMQEEAGVAGTVLHDLGLNRKQVEELVNELSSISKAEVASPDLSADVKRALEKAVGQANKLKHDYIGTEHLLLGLLEQKNSTAMTILDRLGITTQQIRQYTLRKIAGTEDDQSRQPSFPMADERRRVLDMVDDGKITALEGAELLKWLQINPMPFPTSLGMAWMQRFAPSLSEIEKMQKRVLRLVIKKDDEVQFELRRPMGEVQNEIFFFLPRFHSGATGKITNLKGDDINVDVYIDKGEDEGEDEDSADQV